MAATDRQVAVVVFDQGRTRGFLIRAAYSEVRWAWVAEVYEEDAQGEPPAAQWTEWTRASIHADGYARPFEAIGAACAWLAEVVEAPPSERFDPPTGGQPLVNR